jgi:hypothetical protein
VAEETTTVAEETTTTAAEETTTTVAEETTTTTEGEDTTTSTAIATTTTTMTDPGNDTDGDGVPDSSDQCPDTPAGTLTLANGCPPPPVVVNTGLHLHKGWNLLGLKGPHSLLVGDVLGPDADKITSIWKWVCAADDSCKWAVALPNYSPAQNLQYANSKGFSLLDALAPGQGFWANAQDPVDLDDTNYETVGIDAQDAGALLFGQLCQQCHGTNLTGLVGASAQQIENAFTPPLTVQEHNLVLSTKKGEALAAFLATGTHSGAWKNIGFHGPFVTANSPQSCMPCHGDDLLGSGTAQVSCYSCHDLNP